MKSPSLRAWLGLCVLFLSLTGHRLAASSSTDLRALLDAYYTEFQELYPVEAAINGDSDPRLENLWPDELSDAFRARVDTWCAKYLSKLAAFDLKKLPESDQLSIQVLRWNLEQRREQQKHIFHLLPVNQFESDTLTFAQCAAGQYIHPFRTEKDYRNFLERADGFRQWADTAIRRMREGMAQGILQPRILMERVLPQLQPLLSADESKNILFGPLQRMPDTIAEPARSKLIADYRKGVQEVMIPAYARLEKFIREDYLPRCRSTSGIGALKGGREAYAQAVRAQTTTDLNPNTIHQLGLKEVARIRSAIDAIRRRVGYSGTLQQFLAFATSDAQFAPFRAETEVLNAYRAIEGRIRQGVPRLFAKQPKGGFEIRQTEAFRAESASAEYIVGSADGKRPGVFYVPIPDPRKIQTVEMESLFLHEAIPGHHFQLTLTLENQALPKFRRVDANNAYAEGWALYCESLGKELGLYTDPYQELGMLTGEMHRAIRLVVDTGMHARGWTREQALAFAIENEGGDEASNRSEIERYMAWPGQALGYKIGQLKIRELRTLAEQKLGSRFDIRGFHNTILDQGALPMAILEKRVRGWIQNQR